VAQCKQCGTELPDHARFCLQCGAPITPQEPPEPDEPPAPPRPAPPLPDLNFVQPALTGGLFLGLLSSVPIISAGCCIWVLLGGGIAAVLLTRQRPLLSISYGDGAFVGVMSGLFGAVIGTIVQLAFRAITAPLAADQQQQLEKLMDQIGLEGGMRDFLLRTFSGEISTLTVMFTFVSNLLVYALFAMIGGILAIAILRKRSATNLTN
jgi:zinc ribbon protein